MKEDKHDTDILSIGMFPGVRAGQHCFLLSHHPSQLAPREEALGPGLSVSQLTCSLASSSSTLPGRGLFFRPHYVEL
jgi:hypothetical protein